MQLSVALAPASNVSVLLEKRIHSRVCGYRRAAHKSKQRSPANGSNHTRCATTEPFSEPFTLHHSVVRPLLSTFATVVLIMSPVCAPAMGASSTYSQSQEMEAELQRLIQSRLETGQGPLPVLREEKSVRKFGPEVQNALAKQQVEQTQNMAVLQDQLDGLKKTLNHQKAAAHAMVQSLQLAEQAQQQAMQAQQQAEQAQQQAEQVQQAIVNVKQAQQAEQAKPAAQATAQAPAPAPVEQKTNKDSSSGFFSARNGLGVLFAIGWFTFLYLQNQEKVKTEQELAAELSPEQSVVETAHQALDEEQGREKVNSTQASR
ncbi:TPA: hypothetical protein ACH3X3_013581 [Trebouxia sp. C0006]